jgi:hypothetical protein
MMRPSRPFAWLHCFIDACVWACIVVGVCHVVLRYSSLEIYIRLYGCLKGLLAVYVRLLLRVRRCMHHGLCICTSLDNAVHRYVFRELIRHVLGCFCACVAVVKCICRFPCQNLFPVHL